MTTSALSFVLSCDSFSIDAIALRRVTSASASGVSLVSAGVDLVGDVLDPDQDVQLQVERLRLLGRRLRVEADLVVILLLGADLLERVGADVVVGHDQAVARHERPRAAVVEPDGRRPHVLGPARRRREVVALLEGLERQLVERPHPFVGEHGPSGNRCGDGDDGGEGRVATAAGSLRKSPRDAGAGSTLLIQSARAGLRRKGRDVLFPARPLPGPSPPAARRAARGRGAARRGRRGTETSIIIPNGPRDGKALSFHDFGSRFERSKMLLTSTR